MDTVKIKGLEVFAKHGVHPEENTLGQKFVLNITVYTSLFAAAKNDDLELSVSYSDIAREASKFASENTYKLIETLAENLARHLLLKFEISQVEVEVEKPWAPVGLPLKTVSVTVKRGWHTVYIGVGSNMGDRQEHIDNAIDALNATEGIRVTRVSSFIVTEPYGGVEQDDFLNGCLEIETILSPESLLKEINRIEREEGRERLIHWGPRTIDLDILLYDDLRMNSEFLTIPHCDMENREFVLKPLEELIPYYIHPVTGKSIRYMYNNLVEKSNN